MNKIYGYCRISTNTQNIERQIKNILNMYQEARIYQEIFTGTTTERKEWKKLKRVLKTGDTVVFDSVSRMSRNSEEGVNEYMELMEKGINIVFLKEPYINTSVIGDSIEQAMSIDLKAEKNELLKRTEQYIKDILLIQIKQQIKIAFDQSQKEVDDLKERTKEGIRQAKIRGSVPGRPKGAKVVLKKAVDMKKKIVQMSKDFTGNMKDVEVMETLKISRNSYYKYKKELKENRAK